MRWITTQKIYRAFPELDEYSDEQCDLFVKRCRTAIKHSGGVVILPLFIFMFSCCGLSTFIAQAMDYVIRNDIASSSDYLFLLAFLSIAIPSLLLPLIVRDLMLRKSMNRIIHEKLEQLQCRHCKYLLMGIAPINHTTVICPECGQANHLEEMGITASDLLAGDEREVAIKPQGRQ